MLQFIRQIRQYVFLLKLPGYIIIIMEICKVPTLRLKALNKHTHI